MPDLSDQESTSTPAIPLDTSGEAKARFAKAIEEAKAGATALGKQAQDRAGTYGAQLTEQISGKGSELVQNTKALGESAKEMATAYADVGKTHTSDALSSLGRLVADSALTLDEKVGQKAGDVARGAARSLHEAAAALESKDLAQLGEDAKEFVRKSPGVAIGVAAVAGFVLARLFGGGSED
jgi:ElaB/YqjD/DUF883 family membrane-anchored ribosome-binding protein